MVAIHTEYRECIRHFIICPHLHQNCDNSLTQRSHKKLWPAWIQNLYSQIPLVFGRHNKGDNVSDHIGQDRGPFTRMYYASPAIEFWSETSLEWQHASQLNLNTMFKEVRNSPKRAGR